MPKKIGIILVNYKDYAQKYLADCFSALRRQSYPSELTRIYIVDNAASPESEEFLKSHFPEAIILPRADGNYAAANNLGFKRALADGCEYLVNVNMDTVAEAGWLAELAAALENNPEAGIAQSKILLHPKNEAEKAAPKINSLGNHIHFLGFGYTDGYRQPDRAIDGYPEIKGYASGCSFIIRREAFQKVGGYNEEFYMYHDDLELGLKVKLAGDKIILAPRSVIYHKYEFQRSRQMIYYMERNRYLTMLTFYPAYFWLIMFLPCLVMDTGLFFFSMINGWFKEELKIYAYFFWPFTYKRIFFERRRVKRLKIVPFSRIARDFVGRIEFQEVANPILKYLVNPLFAGYWWVVKHLL